MMEPIVSENHDFFSTEYNANNVKDGRERDDDEVDDVSVSTNGDVVIPNEDDELLNQRVSALLENITADDDDDDDEEMIDLTSFLNNNKTETKKKNDDEDAVLDPTFASPTTPQEPSSSYFSILDKEETKIRKRSTSTSPKQDSENNNNSNENESMSSSSRSSEEEASDSSIPRVIDAIGGNEGMKNLNNSEDDATAAQLLMQHQIQELQKRNRELQEQNHALQKENEILQEENEILIAEQDGDVWTEENLTSDGENEKSSTGLKPSSSSNSLANAEREELLKTIEQLKDRITGLVEEKLHLQTTVDTLEHQFVDVELDDSGDNPDSGKRGGSGGGRLMNLFQHQSTSLSTKSSTKQNEDAKQEGRHQDDEPAVDESASQGDMIQAALTKKKRSSIFSPKGDKRADLRLDANGEKLNLEMYRKLVAEEEAAEYEKDAARRLRANNTGNQGLSGFSKQQQELLKQDAMNVRRRGIRNRKADPGLMAPSAITPTSSYIDSEENYRDGYYDRETWSSLNDDIVTDTMVASMVGSDAYQAKFIASALEKQQEVEKQKRKQKRWRGKIGLLNRNKNDNTSATSSDNEGSSSKDKNNRDKKLPLLSPIDTKPRPLLMDVDKLSIDRDSSNNSLASNKNRLVPSLGKATTTATTNTSSSSSTPPVQSSPSVPRTTSIAAPKVSLRSKADDKTETATAATTTNASNGDKKKDETPSSSGKEGMDQQPKQKEQSEILDGYVTQNQKKRSPSFFSRVFSSTSGISKNGGNGTMMNKQDEDMIKVQEDLLRRQMERKRIQDANMRTASPTTPSNTSAYNHEVPVSRHSTNDDNNKPNNSTRTTKLSGLL